MNDRAATQRTLSREAIRVSAAEEESLVSGVCWSAVIAGAFAAASCALILTILGVGLGLSSVSPWSGIGASAAALGAGAIVWLVASQVVASSLGGYLAGRLRTKWSGVHDDEVYFRDTAHGFLAWAVGVVIAVALLSSAATSYLGSAAKLAGSGAVAAAAVGAGAGAGASGPRTAATASSDRDDSGRSARRVEDAYLLDTLFRSTPASGSVAQTGVRPEVERILAQAVASGTLPAADKSYAGQLVAAQTGLSAADAEARVDATYQSARALARRVQSTERNAADAARRASAKASLWIFVSLLAGAFLASVSALYGGRERDHLPSAHLNPF